jgi:hypothetical protein
MPDQSIPIRGRWTVDKRLIDLWNASTLNTDFRARWQQKTNTSYLVLHEDEAEPSPAGPYCVYSIAEPRIVGHATGYTKDSEFQLQDIDIDFRVQAQGDTRETGKEKVIKLAKLVASVYDDAEWDIFPDGHVSTTKQPDFGGKEGKESYVWVVPYTLQINATLRRTQRGRITETG